MLNQTGQDLCKQCGLCCDGTLFNTVPVDPATEHLFTRINMNPHGGCEQLLPCGSCKIYEKRPQGCRSFKCGVLKDFEKGNLKYKEAQKIINDVKKVIAVPDDYRVPPKAKTIEAFRNWGKKRHDTYHETAKFHLPGMESSEKNSDL